MRKLIPLLALSALLSFAGESERLPFPEQLKSELPWFAMDMKDGEKSYNGLLNNKKLKELVANRGSKRVAFAFFATWCVPCKEGLARMSAKASELKEKGILVILVNAGESDYAKVDLWAGEYSKDGWLLCFDSFSNIPGDFGLLGQNEEMPLPKTLVMDKDLKPLILIGHEGDDFPQILWEGL